MPHKPRATKNVVVEKEVYNRFLKEAEKADIPKEVFLEHLLDFYDVQHVDLLIRKLRHKRDSFSISPKVQAQLLILRSYLEYLGGIY
jgi:hypothetical protein